MRVVNKSGTSIKTHLTVVSDKNFIVKRIASVPKNSFFPQCSSHDHASVSTGSSQNG